MQIIRALGRHLDLIVPLFDAYRVFYGQPSDRVGARKFLRKLFTHNASFLFLAVDYDPSLHAYGFAQLFPTYTSVGMRRSYVLEDLFTAPALRRHGIATMLLQRAIEFARESGAGSLYLETAYDNAPAQALYEKLGWTREERFYKYNFTIETSS